MTTLADAIRSFPRATLCPARHPSSCWRLSDTGIEVYAKRDDLTGLGMGGKGPPFQFYFGAPRARTILITGAVQSNYVRAAAAAAAKLGLDAVVQLEERVSGMDATYYTNGNVLLDDLLGARRISFPGGENEAGADAALYGEADRLRERGRKPYVIPLAINSPPLGALRYMCAAQELQDQRIAFDHVVVASGSGQTHAGLLSGMRVAGLPQPVHGACVRRPADLQQARITTLVCKLEHARLRPLVGRRRQDLRYRSGAGYGLSGASQRASKAFVDPVYGKDFGRANCARARPDDCTRIARALCPYGRSPRLVRIQQVLRAANHPSP